VHVISNGRIVKSGSRELALELEQQGYAQFEPPSRPGRVGEEAAR
jgi:Fe-S cluster assembly ATPase SufC